MYFENKFVYFIKFCIFTFEPSPERLRCMKISSYTQPEAFYATDSPFLLFPWPSKSSKYRYKEIQF